MNYYIHIQSKSSSSESRDKYQPKADDHSKENSTKTDNLFSQQNSEESDKDIENPCEEDLIEVCFNKTFSKKDC